MLRARKHRATPRRWGWKEPNTHVFLDLILETFPSARYVHVVRHGLDMATSGNQTQYFNWAPLFGLPHSRSRPAVDAALRYWVRANGRVFERAQHEPRIVWCDFETLCARPKEVVGELLSSLDVRVDAATMARLVAMPRRPPSAGRRATIDPSTVDDEDLRALAAMGFEL